MPSSPVQFLRTPEAIRERAENIFRAEREHFDVRLDELPAVVEMVREVTRAAYPDGNIPIHGRFRHFGEARLALLDETLSGVDKAARARAQIDLVVTSVLLDAGAGARWRYLEPRTGEELKRSEGLAVASFHMFMAGAFSHEGGAQATAAGLQSVNETALANGFQVEADNPLVGLEGRAELLRALGRALELKPELFGETGRPGHLFDSVDADARALLHAVLSGLSSIWPKRLSLDGENLGDVWRHRLAGGNGASAGLVPFHKLSQWLTYSLVEPFEQGGRNVANVDSLTGLAEYRNGGLFVDLGVVVPKHDAVVRVAHTADSEIVVEWRALTIALLDRVAEALKMPIPRLLEGGTWQAGRIAARERREDGSPPIRIESDGTVF